MSRIELACAISDFYRLCATALTFPDARLADALQNGDLAKDLLSIAIEVGVCTSDADELRRRFETACTDDQSVIDALRIEYTRLFDHPRKPVLSLYETTVVNEQAEALGKAVNRSLFVSPAARDAARQYGAAGFETVRDSGNEPADHICYELGFLAALHAEFARAVYQSNNSAAQDYAARIREFNTSHVNRWFHGFFETLGQEGTGLYGIIGSCYLLVEPKLEADLA